MPDNDENVPQFLVLSAQPAHGTLPVGGKEVSVVALEVRATNLQFVEDGEQTLYLVFAQEDIKPLTRGLKIEAEKVLPLGWQLKDTDPEETTPA